MVVQILSNVLNSCPLKCFAAGIALLVSVSSYAAPAAYGKYFLRAEPGVDSGVAAQSGPAIDRDKLQRLLEERELVGGPYADTLTEPLAQLGDQLFAVGDYPAAVIAYRRALHVLRINDGLYSERQVPVLRQLILAFRATQDWQTLDGRYEYFFRVYGRGQPPYTELRLRAALEYLRWQREAVQLKLGGEPRRLLDLVSLNGDLLKATMNDSQAPYAWKKGLAQSQMENLYLVMDVIEPLVRQAEFSNSRDIFGAQPLSADLDQQRMSGLLRTAPAKGRQIVQALQLAAGDDTVEIAALDLALGDWHHWTGNRYRAAEAYTRVEQNLREAGETALLKQWLGAPVALPANNAFVRPLPDENLVRVNALFDVSRQGRVSNVRVEALDDKSSSTSRFRRRLNATLFRPQWEGGEPVESRVEREYKLLP